MLYKFKEQNLNNMINKLELIQMSILYDYIDKIVAGEDAMKPDLESFELAIGNTNKEDYLTLGYSG